MTRPVTPQLTVDAIIELRDREGSPIVLVDRKYPPYGWAIPGGFVEVGETVSQAVVREAKEETTLDIELDVVLSCYSNPQRDHRGHTACLVYVAHATGEPVAADDAAAVRVFDPFDVDVELAFDHRKILDEYCEYRRHGTIPLPE